MPPVARATKTEVLFGQSIDRWDAAKEPLTGTPVAKFKPMMQRMEMKTVDKLVEASAEGDEPAGNGTHAVQVQVGDPEADGTRVVRVRRKVPPAH